jgi:hypothetical protein
MEWQWTFIEADTTTTVVDEPVGWDGVSFSLQRDNINHGIFSTVDTGSFQWVGDAYNILSSVYSIDGANGQLELLFEYRCEGEDTYTEYFRGAFDFNTFERVCDDFCYIKCTITAAKCTDIFMSRMGQDVDVESTTNFDGDAITPMSFTPVILEGQDIFLQNKAFNLGTNSGTGVILPTGASTQYFFSFCPVVPANNLQEIGEFNLNGVSLVSTTSGNVSVAADFATDAPAAFSSYGQFLTIWNRTSDPLNCIDNDATIDIINKGTFNVTFSTAGNVPGDFFDGEITPILKLFKYNSITGALVLIDTNSIGTIVCPSGVPQSLAFNKTYFSTPNYQDSDYLLYFFECFTERTAWDGLSVRVITFNVDFDSTTKVVMTLNSNCDPTTTNGVFLPNLLEFLPTAYLDSECPTVTIEEDLRDCLENYQITKGSFIRQVVEPSVPKLFTNFEYMIEQTRKLFNIGWGFDNNETVLKIGNTEDFYKSNLVVDVGLVDKATFTTAKDLIYGTITVGYNKWEAEEYNGLDETNTQRQYRRNIDSNPTELDLMADIISAGYTIEITRRKSQAKTGTSDWRYDDDLFIINTFVDDGSVYAYRGASDTANLYSPSTRMNLRLTPLRTLMRWFKSIAAPTPTITNEALKFTSGTGNYIAESRFADQCFIETGIVTENQTVISTDVTTPTPIWQAIYATFNAPLTMAQFELIKADVYGAIRFRCFSDTYLGNIVEMNHDPNVGLASFKLLIRK